MTPKAKVIFEYCKSMTSVTNFETYTNIRRLVESEIKLNSIENQHINIEECIEKIFTDFIKLPEAWCWTLLRKIHLRPKFFQSQWFLEYKGVKECTVNIPSVTNEV